MAARSKNARAQSKNARARSTYARLSLKIEGYTTQSPNRTRPQTHPAPSIPRSPNPSVP